MQAYKLLMSKGKSFVRFEEVFKTYKIGGVEVSALNGLTFDVSPGEFVVVVGPSGAGKTTLLNLLGGMDNATCGEIVVDGKTISNYNERQLTEYRRNDVGFVFQFYNLMPNLTAIENVELAVEICRDPLLPEEVMRSVGLEHRKNNFPSQLSGGEQQRVSIARSVAKNSRLILCDEPTGALDYETGKKILKLLHSICKEKNKTVVLVTHNAALRDMADKVVVIKNGRAEEVIVNAHPKSIDRIEW